MRYISREILKSVQKGNRAPQINVSRYNATKFKVCDFQVDDVEFEFSNDNEAINAR